MPNEALTNLAERIERAEGPSRELIEDIARAVGWRRTSLHWWRQPGGKDVWTFDLPRWLDSIDAALSLVPEGWQIKIELDRSFSDRSPACVSIQSPDNEDVWTFDLPRWLDSIDAALSLVPEGWQIKIELDRSFSDRSPACVSIQSPDNEGATNAALALTAAALRARAQGAADA